MTGIIDAAIAHSRTTLLIMLMVVIAGLYARGAMPIENDPYVQVPFFAVTVYHEGISPEDAERLLVLPLEIEMRAVEGVEEVTSYAYEGGASVMVEFDADFDLDNALLDVREAVDRSKPEMPSTIEEPIIREETTDDFPILQVNLVGDQVPERVLYDHAMALRDAIESISDVRDAELQGHREEMLEAVIDPDALEGYQISGEELINTIVRNNRLIPAGSLDTGSGRFAVKVPSVIEEASDLFDLPIRAQGDAVVTLSDVASVRRTFKDRSSFARVNGQRTISINVLKRTNANIIDTIEQVKQAIAAYQENLPGKITIFYTQDQAPFASSQVTELQGNIFTALALVMVVVVAAIGLRSGIIVGLGIPISFLFSLIFINTIGYTFNFMVMFGMLLGLGMLIDGAIVVTEYADRKMVEGYDSRSAYTLAAKRMFWPVTASIFTTLAAFLPLMFWPGVMGKFMRYLPVTVFTVLSGSLIYALIFGPTLGALFGQSRCARQSLAGKPQAVGGRRPDSAQLAHWLVCAAVVSRHTLRAGDDAAGVARGRGNVRLVQQLRSRHHVLLRLGTEVRADHRARTRQSQRNRNQQAGRRGRGRGAAGGRHPQHQYAHTDYGWPVAQRLRPNRLDVLRAARRGHPAA